MLTKKECEMALKNIALSYDAEYVNECNDEFCQAMKNYIKMLENLIEEHFYNPPLKFEELKEGMWVWDNKDKYYFKCNPRISTDMAECVWYESFWYNTGEGYDEFYEDYIEFEPNRFYRKEVQE